ncbi:hypothetical protein Nepgr_028459 [Nepenthes gracilis]|uniref:Cytochrome P450 n=1 Tax=Nepenthes gracilis TaxID=150966 RepID=A0AAD3TD44_NEPGR|nr:hypothetical protein Nepgr_028459 [Nepenthes gracilis]
MDLWNSMLPILLLWISSYFILSFLRSRNLSSKKLPPGPSPSPIIGNLFNLGRKPHRSLAELSRVYGPIISLRLGYQTMVVISSPSSAKEVLQKQDPSFSNRHVPHVVTALHHHESSVLLLSPNSRWRNIRKIMNTLIFSVSRLDANQGLRREKVQQLLSYAQNCCESGTAINVSEAVFNTSLNFIWSSFFSVDLIDLHSDHSSEFKELVWGILSLIGTPNISDLYPMLKVIDPQGIRRRATVLAQKIFRLFDGMIDDRLRSRKETGSSENNDMLDALLNIIQDSSMELELSDIPHLLLDLFVAATETSSSTLEWAMAELLHKPEKLKKAQAELETVTRKGVLVEEEKIAQLPYLQAVMKETLRMHPPAPFLIPRKVDEDVELSGFVVPRSSQVLVNVWAMGRDPDLWPDADLFKPERFLPSRVDYKGHDFELLPFGAGRRMCPGMSLATRLLQQILGSLINSFEWKLEDGISPEGMDMDEKFGFVVAKAQPLRVIPIRMA